jgi:two-component system, OmpR family, KDP operon response regulator KdpE
VAEKILAIDDDYLVLRLIQYSMEKLGYEVITATNGLEGIELFHQKHPHLIILDLMMPQMDGWETCRSLRHISKVPIIILSARGSQQDVLKGLKMGADDYLVKPFYPEELQARVEAVLRRTRIPSSESDKLPLRFGGSDLIIDPVNRQVLVHNKAIDLTPTEYDLLLYMARNIDRVLPIEVIFENVWPYYADASLNSVKWYIWRLRRKIEDDPRHPHFILTEHGIGYRFSDI